MVSAGEQVGTKCSILFTHITGLWLYESHSWCLGHWAPISLENREIQYIDSYESIIWIYVIIAVILFAAGLLYFKIADKCNIIDKPNQRSSHTSIVLRGGGIIFAISILVWLIWQMVMGNWGTVQGFLPFIIGLVLICGISFWDDIHSLPDSVRLVVQFLVTGLMFWGLMGQGTLLMQERENYGGVTENVCQKVA